MGLNRTRGSRCQSFEMGSCHETAVIYSVLNVISVLYRSTSQNEDT